MSDLELTVLALWRASGTVNAASLTGISEPRTFTAVFAAGSFDDAAARAGGVLIAHARRKGWYVRGRDAARVAQIESAGSVYRVDDAGR